LIKWEAALEDTLKPIHRPKEDPCRSVFFNLRIKMKELIEYIAKSLVDNREEVSVTELEGAQTTVIELKVAKDDMGKIIGKQGRTARAIRTILGAASAKMKKRFVLEILE
jgi:uncharacterized protein